MRWLPVTFLALVLCAPLSAAQATRKPSASQQANQQAAHKRNSHPSHPMRNTRPKHHARATTHTSLLAVRYRQPQQAGSAVSTKTSSSSGSKSAGHSSPASSKKKKSSKKSRHSRRQPLQKAPTPERISEIQSSLARGGYYQGEPNGKWDPNTVAAMQKFQSANGLDPSGKLDAASLQKLGLGSGIAGVSAPKPPCCSTSPAQGSSCCSRSPGNGSSTAPAPAPAASTPANPTSSKATEAGSTSASNAAANQTSSAASASTAVASSATGTKPSQQ